MGIIIFCIYSLVLMGATLFFCRTKANEESFFINSRSSSSWQVGFSIIASCVGASATIGTIGLAFEAGTPAFWWLGTGSVGLAILAIFLAKKIRQSRAKTLPELMSAFFTPKANRIVSIIIVTAWLSILAAQLTAMSRIVGTLTGFSPGIALLCGGFLITFQTMAGGQAGVIKLDRWQTLLIIAGLATVLGWMMQQNPAGLSSIPIEAVNQKFPLSRLAYYLIILGASYVICPMLFGRLFSAKDEQAARNGTLGAALALAAISILIVSIGLAARGFVPADTVGDAVLTTALQSFPAWLGLTVTVVLMTAIVSAADSCLITVALIFSSDILGKNDLRTSRFCMLALICASMLVSLMDKNILGFLLMANDIYVCGVVGPVFIGLIRPEATGRSPLVAVAVVLGGTLGLISSITEITYLSYVGLATSSILTLIGTYVSPKPVIASN